MRGRSINTACSAIGIMILVGLQSAGTATITVTTTGDAGAGSLRDALVQANVSSEADTILFNIPGAGLHIIRPESALPAITGTVIIDGYSQPGTAPATETSIAVLSIVIDGINTSSVDGFDIHADHCGISGLVIGRFDERGVQVSAGTGGFITGNHVGIDASGWLPMPNGNAGIRIAGDASGWRVGGVVPSDRNVVSSNGHAGIVSTEYSSNNTIQGNYVGVDATGTLPMGNAHDGILMGGHSHHNTVGGTMPGARNVSCDNVGGGVAFATDAHDNVALGNYLGVDATGMNGLGNHKMGAGLVHTARNNTIGGSVPGSGNVISSNDWSGVHIEDSVSGTVVRGNLIGVTATDLSPLANTQHGVNLIGGTWGNVIGGEGENEGNTIMFNALDGISITAGLSNEISGNVIFNNTGIGIDLGPNGVTANDPGDGDSGSNGLQNYPLIISVTSDDSTPFVTGRLSSTPFFEYRLEFFANSEVDPTLFGEGEMPLFSRMLTTDSAGHAPFQFSLPEFILDGYWITATAADAAGNTSEFSNAKFLFVLDATEISGETVLTWTEVDGADAYWIYGSQETPYFIPYVSPGYENRIAAVAGSVTTWSTSQGVGDSEENWSYLVIAVDETERELARSNRVGEMDFDL